MIVNFFTEHPINILLLLVAVICSILLVFPALLRRGGQYALDTLQAIRLINHKNAQVWDIRSMNEYTQGHVINARHMPQATIQKAPLPSNKAISLLLVCQNGREAEIEAKKLRDQGYTEVYILAGGMNAWVAAGLPLHK